jgi:ComF family protein
MLMSRLRQNIFRDILNLIFPAYCICCNDFLSGKRTIICESCFSRINSVSEQQKAVFLERIDKPYFDELFIKFHFSELFQQLMHYFKYQGYTAIADYLAASVIEIVENTYDFITAVPLHHTKKRERGFNQSEILAQKIGHLKDIEYADILERMKYTSSQTRLSRSQRKENMTDAFKMVREVKNKSLLIVDDVITTAATLNECARILKDAGAARVDILAMATPVDILQEKLESNSLM